MNELLRRKPLAKILAEANEEGGTGLRRALGVWNLIALGIGATIGAGIFLLTGTAAARNAGPGIVLSFLLAGFGCALAGLCYAEFAAMLPVAGSAYTYAYATLGEIFAWIIGWDLVLEYAFSTATVASGFSANLTGLLAEFGIVLPEQLVNPPLNLPAFSSVLVVTAILVRGIRESANFNFVIVLLKVATVLIFCGTAAQYLLRHPQTALAHWTPLVPPNTGEFGHFGWSGVARGAAVIFFAYIGFDSVSTAAQEAKNPRRDMPVGLLASLAICTVLYMATALMLTGVAPYHELDVAAPVAHGMDRTGVAWGGMLVRLGTLFGLTTTMLVTLLGQSRVFFAMSRDGLLPPWIGAVHPRYLTPHRSLWMVGFAVAIISAIFPINELGQLVSIGTLLAFAIVSGAVMVLRYRSPELERPFRTPLFPYVPILAIVVALGLMASLPAVTWLRLAGWLVIGMAIYGWYGRKKSRVKEASPSAVPGVPVVSG